MPAPKVMWIRRFDNGLGGSLVMDRNDDIYVWYDMDFRVIKYDRKGKVLWDKRFSSTAPFGFLSVTADPNGQLHASRVSGNSAVLSRLLATGQLTQDVNLPSRRALISGSYAIDGNGGWVAVDHGQSESDKMGLSEYLSRYSSEGKAAWSVFLRERKLSANYLNTPLSSLSALPLGLRIDMENNIYLLQGSPSISGQGGGGGMVAARLLKFSPDGKLLWNVPVSSGNNVVRSLGLDQDSNAYVLGQYEEHGYYLSKWNSSGKHAWTCNGPSRAADIVDHLSVSKKGVLFVGGQTDGSNRRASAFVAKHDEHGSLLWRRDLSQVNQIAGLASDGVSVYVSGRVQQSDQKMYLLRIQ